MTSKDKALEEKKKRVNKTTGKEVSDALTKNGEWTSTEGAADKMKLEERKKKEKAMKEKNRRLENAVGALSNLIAPSLNK